jgi:peptidoglycan-associated lipoprotein
MSNRRSSLVVLLVVAVLIVVPACKKKQADTAPTPPPEPVKEAPPAPPPEPIKEVEEPGFQGEEIDVVEITPEQANEQLQTVYFAFDKYDLDDLARSVLKRNAQWLGEHSDFGVIISGYCDERGTIEYNLALGEKRAAAVRDYLASLGLAPDRVRIISYGEEFPADPGHSEAAWAKNRRATTTVE